MRSETDAQEDPAARVTNVPYAVTSVTVLPGFRLHVRFLDGVEGEVDMSELVKAPDAGVFAELADPVAFSNARVVNYYVAWPTGQDLAPDAMHDEIARNGRWILR